MSIKTFDKIRFYGIAIVLLFVWAHLIWLYFHAGVPRHHIMDREDLPAISSWWGGLLLPLLAWITFYRIRQRLNKQVVDQNAQNKMFGNILFGFSGALVFGLLLSVAFAFGYMNFINYQVDSLLVFFFLIPIFRSEYLLGFVIGMTITFGAILPTGFAIIVASMSALVYLFIRPQLFRLFYFFKEKLRQSTAK